MFGEQLAGDRIVNDFSAIRHRHRQPDRSEDHTPTQSDEGTKLQVRVSDHRSAAPRQAAEAGYGKMEVALNKELRDVRR